jgi:hypothetical protein
MTPVVLAYLVGFAAVYLVALSVVMGFAARWRQRMRDAEKETKLQSVRRLVKLSAATADVEDALSYQKRANEAARARIRKAEEAARESARAAEANAVAVDESRAAGARLASSYMAGTDLLSEHAKNMSAAATTARQRSLERARENSRLLRELERSIDALHKGATTPAEVEAEVAKLHAEMEEHRKRTQEASDGFYSKVAQLLSASESAQRETVAEISTMYATKDEAEKQAAALAAQVDAAKSELDRQYDMAIGRAGEVEAACGLRNSKELDGAALDNIRTAYDNILEKLAEYTFVVEKNETKWGELDRQLSGVETTVADALRDASKLNDEVSRSLTRLDDYIRSNCTTKESVALLMSEVDAAEADARRVREQVQDARLSCEASKRSCDDSSAKKLTEGGAVEVDGLGRLTMRGGVVRFCTRDNACTDVVTPQAPARTTVPPKVRQQACPAGFSLQGEECYRSFDMGGEGTRNVEFSVGSGAQLRARYDFRKEPRYKDGDYSISSNFGFSGEQGGIRDSHSRSMDWTTPPPDCTFNARQNDGHGTLHVWVKAVREEVPPLGVALHSKDVPNPGKGDANAWRAEHFEDMSLLRPSTFGTDPETGFFETSSFQWYGWLKNVPPAAGGVAFDFKAGSAGGGNNTDVEVRLYDSARARVLASILFGYERGQFTTTFWNGSSAETAAVQSLPLSATTKNHRYELRIGDGVGSVSITAPDSGETIYVVRRQVEKPSGPLQVLFATRAQADVRKYTFGNISILHQR